MILLSFFLSFLGFLDAAYLSILHFKHIIPPCTITGSNCEEVLTSQYATIFGIPVALIGAVYFLGLLAIFGILLQRSVILRHQLSFPRKRESIPDGSPIRSRMTILTFLKFLTFIALLVSAILVYIQAGILHAFCQYCLTVEGINIVLFGIIWIVPKKKSN